MDKPDTQSTQLLASSFCHVCFNIIGECYCSQQSKPSGTSIYFLLCVLEHHCNCYSGLHQTKCWLGSIMWPLSLGFWPIHPCCQVCVECVKHIPVMAGGLDQKWHRPYNLEGHSSPWMLSSANLELPPMFSGALQGFSAYGHPGNSV